MDGEWLLLLCFALTAAIQCSCFAIAFLLQFDKITDLAGTFNFFVLAVVSLIVQNVYSTRAIVVTSITVIWAVRLGVHLFTRVLKRGKDERFDKMRSNCVAFFGFWVFQIIWVFVVSLPVILVNSVDKADAPAFGDPRDIIGLVVWVIGLAFEWAADASKEKFYDDKTNRGKLLSSGVWKYSRHPNYFGEITCWIGVTILASPSLSETSWFFVSVLSPVLTFVLLMFLSGVPMSEDRYDERFGAQAFYLDYKRSTSPLIPLPPAVYKELPEVVKKVLFLELPMYSRKLRSMESAVTPADLSHADDAIYRAIP